MRNPIPGAIVMCLLAGPLAASAFAVTAEDLVNLKCHGLGDDVLVALVETDGSQFQLSADDVLALQKRGLSDKVLLAMIRSGRRLVTPLPTADDAEMPSVRTPKSAAPAQYSLPQEPTAIAVYQTIQQSVLVVPSPAPIVVRPPAPVYWGFGGQLRPDAWKPATPDKDKGRDEAPARPATKTR